MVKTKQSQLLEPQTVAQTRLRAVKARGADRRQTQATFSGDDRRQAPRRADDLARLEALVEEYKSENERLRKRNAELSVPLVEELLWYFAIGLGLLVIAGWHVALLLQ